MNKNQLLTITSLVSIVLLILHVSDDISRGFDSAGLSNLIAIAVVAVLLYCTLIYRERLAGQIAMLLIALLALGMPLIHLRGTRINEHAQSTGGLFFIATLWLLGVTGIFGIVLAAQEMWKTRRQKVG